MGCCADRKTEDPNSEQSKDKENQQQQQGSQANDKKVEQQQNTVAQKNPQAQNAQQSQESAKVQNQKVEEQKQLNSFPSDPQTEEFIQKIDQMIQEIELDVKDGWTPFKNENNVEFEKKPYKQNWVAFQISTEIPQKTIQQVLPFFLEIQSIKKWKDNLKDLKVLKEFNPQTKVLQEQQKMASLITDREFVYMQKVQQAPMQTIIYEKSFVYPGTEQPSKNHERGQLYTPNLPMANGEKLATKAFEQIGILRKIIIG